VFRECSGVSTGTPKSFFRLTTASLGMLPSIYRQRLFFCFVLHPGVLAVNNTIMLIVDDSLGSEGQTRAKRERMKSRERIPRKAFFDSSCMQHERELPELEQNI